MNDFEKNNKMKIFMQIENILTVDMGFYCQNLSTDFRFKEDMGMDSLDLVELTVLTEKWFNIEIEDEEAIKVNTISDIIQLVKQKTPMNGI